MRHERYASGAQAGTGWSASAEDAASARPPRRSRLWTLPPAAGVIEKEFGRRASETQVWRIFESMNWSCQRPTGRAMKRNERAIQEWKKKRWPTLGKRHKNLEAIVGDSRN